MKYSIIFCFFIINMFAQNKEAAESILLKTEVAIYKLHKEIIRSNEHSKVNKLILAVQYQVKAVQLFKDLKFSDAISFSIKSREICIQNFIELSLDQSQTSYYSIESNEMLMYKPESVLNFNPEKNISEKDIFKPGFFSNTLNISINNN